MFNTMGHPTYPLVIASERVPILIWTDALDPDALQQAKNIANLPFAFHHIALMPDAHTGYGMPIGGVLAAMDHVVPNAVGVDIGCGMCAVKTSLQTEEIDRKTLIAIMETIRRAIPLGFKHHRGKRPAESLPLLDTQLPVVEQEFEAARTQIGTLGGGNHFIEIQRDEQKKIWLMVHSGSRNLGFKVAHHYNRLAEKKNMEQKNPLPKKWQLAALPLHSKQALSYLDEMRYCVSFALANRMEMLAAVMSIFSEFYPALSFGDTINIAHNYAASERHFNREVMVHRKGATRAGKDETGIIPGSQGTTSFIVRGKGAQDSFQSCSHGAGRIMGRKEARRRLDLDWEKKQVDRAGIIHSIRSKGDLDEAPGAYKDITEVIAAQKDLVEVITVLQPLAVVKG